MNEEKMIPVCPEQLGGQPTPRPLTEISGGDGLDVKEAIFKARSPSCGCGSILDGTFSDKLIEGDGVTTALLRQKGIKVMTEEDL